MFSVLQHRIHLLLCFWSVYLLVPPAGQMQEKILERLFVLPLFHMSKYHYYSLTRKQVNVKSWWVCIDFSEAVFPHVYTDPKTHVKCLILLRASLQVHISISQHGDQDSVYNALPQGHAERGSSRVARETPLPTNLSAENQHPRKRLQKYDESAAFTHRNYQVRLGLVIRWSSSTQYKSLL